MRDARMRRYVIVAALLGAVYVALLWVPSYAKAEPSLGGFPFFYWYSMLWIVLNALSQLAAYQLVVARPRARAPAIQEKRAQ